MAMSTSMAKSCRSALTTWAQTARPYLSDSTQQTQWANDVIAYIESFKTNTASATFQKFYERTRADVLKPAMSASLLGQVDTYVGRKATVPV